MGDTARRASTVARIPLLSLVLITTTMSVCDRTRELPPVLDLIPGAWEGYTRRFIDSDGRVYRPRDGGDTVSEGQAYALLIASWLDDRGTFDRVMRWTEQHLSRTRRTGDHLLAWRWEPTKGVTDWNSAADADVDYALALLLAHRRWRDEGYARRARLVLRDVLELETEVVGAERYLLPGTWRPADGVPVINPSYLSPAHFRVFSTCTGDPRWNDIVDGSYHLIARVSRRFDRMPGIGLIPDWVRVTADGEFEPAPGLSARFGWDAIRALWRVGTDYLLFEEPRAKRFLDDMAGFYSREWERQGGRFFVAYTYDGQPAERYEGTAAYAMSVAPLAVRRSPVLSGVFEKLENAFNHRERVFERTDDYYENSLALLGLILYRESITGAGELRGLRCGSAGSR